MIVKLREIGEVLINRAVKTECGDIEVFSETGFSEIVSKTYFAIKSAYLVEADLEWYFYIDLDLDEETSYETQSWRIFDIENQTDIYRLNAFL